MQSDRRRAWALDQLQKSLFFHQKLHEWELLGVAEELENISGESLDWDLQYLGITSLGWNRLIHSGIKPIVVFAHPTVLTTVAKAVSYYRMLAMVSQKSMSQIGLPMTKYEQGQALPTIEVALLCARRLNSIISRLVESDTRIERREFDIWRGMAAGSQAQGSWQNRKGDLIESLLRQDLVSQLHSLELIEADQTVDVKNRIFELPLRDGRIVRFGSEPDILVYNDYRIHAAVEVKGGIDTAGVLERVGAAIKSLSRAKDESPGAITILIMTAVSMSHQAKRDIEANKSNVNYWFTVEDIMEDADLRQRYYSLMGLSP